MWRVSRCVDWPERLFWVAVDSDNYRTPEEHVRVRMNMGEPYDDFVEAAAVAYTQVDKFEYELYLDWKRGELGHMKGAPVVLVILDGEPIEKQALRYLAQEEAERRWESSFSDTKD